MSFDSWQDFDIRGRKSKLERCFPRMKKSNPRKKCRLLSVQAIISALAGEPDQENTGKTLPVCLIIKLPI
jgi:hypothetical protein